MRPHLPVFLFCALTACFSALAGYAFGAAAVPVSIVNTAIPQPADPEYITVDDIYIWDNTHLRLDGNWCTRAESALFWSHSQSGVYELSGKGVLDTKMGIFSIGSPYLGGSAEGRPTATYIIDSGICLKDTFIEVGEKTSLIFKGSIELSPTPVTGGDINGNIYFSVGGGTMDLTDADLHHTSGNLELYYMFCGGRIICPQYRVDGRNSLTYQEDAVFEGNLTLDSGGWVYAGGFGAAPLMVEGNITLSGDTTFELPQIEVGRILMSCTGSIFGSTDDLNLATYECLWNEETGGASTVISLSDDYRVTRLEYAGYSSLIVTQAAPTIEMRDLRIQSSYDAFYDAEVAVKDTHLHLDSAWKGEEKTLLVWQGTGDYELNLNGEGVIDASHGNLRFVADAPTSFTIGSDICLKDTGLQVTQNAQVHVEGALSVSASSVREAGMEVVLRTEDGSLLDLSKASLTHDYGDVRLNFLSGGLVICPRFTVDAHNILTLNASDASVFRGTLELADGGIVAMLTPSSRGMQVEGNLSITGETAIVLADYVAGETNIIPGQTLLSCTGSIVGDTDKLSLCYDAADGLGGFSALQPRSLDGYEIVTYSRNGESSLVIIPEPYDIILNEAQPLSDPDSFGTQYEFNHASLKLKGDWFPPVSEPGDMVNITWNGCAGEKLLLSGQGTIATDGGWFYCDGGADFTIGSEICLKNTGLTILSGRTVFNGSVEISPSSWPMEFDVWGNSVLDISHADLSHEEGTLMILLAGGRIVSSTFAVDRNNILQLSAVEGNPASTWEGSLTLGAGGRVIQSQDPLSVFGDIVVNGNTTFLFWNELTELTEGLTLMTCTGNVVGDTSTLRVGVFGPESYSPTDSFETSSLWVDVIETETGHALVTTTTQPRPRSHTHTWTASKGVWYEGCPIGSSVYADGDTVLFKTAASVTISGQLKPAAVVVDSSANITWVSDKKVYGSGIGGEGTLTKSGTGTLTLNAGNSYSGGTMLNAGTIKATAADSFGSGVITVNGGTLDLGSKPVSNDVVLSGTATLKGDVKYAGNVTVDGDATLLAKISYKGLTTIGEASSLTLAEKVTLAGSLVVDGALRILDTKGLTLVKNQTLTLDNAGSVNGLVTIGAGGTLEWNDGSMSQAPVLKGGTVDLGAEPSLIITGSKAQVAFGAKVVDLPGKGVVYTDDALTVKTGTVTVNALDGYAGELVVNDGTLKLATGKATTENDIVVNGTAAVVNGGTHYGNITVDGLLAKGTTIKLLDEYQKVALNGDGALLGTISGAGIVDVRGDVDITGAKLTNANILLGGTLTHAKGLTLAKGQTLTLDGGSVNGTLTIGNGAVLDLNGHTLTAAPVLKGGTYDDGGSNTLTLTGAKADISLGEQQVSLLSKSFIKSDAVLAVNSGTITVNDFGTSEQALTVTGGTLKLATGKQTSRNTIVVNGTAAVVNGATHYGDIEVNGELAKGTTIKLLTADQRVVLMGGETLLGTISGAGIIDVNASINATAAKLTAATININSGCTFTNTKGIKLAKGQTLNLTGASLDLGAKGVLATVAGSMLGVSGNNTLTGSLTLGGGELVFSEGGTLTLDGTLTLSKPVTVTGSGSITYDTLKPIKGELSAFFGDAEVKQDGNTILITSSAPALRMAAAPLATAAEAPAPLDAAPAIPVVNPVVDAMVQADWGIIDAERAFMGAVNSRSQHAALLDKGRGAAWVSAFGASVRHGNQGTHHGSDGNIEGAAFGLEHAVSETGTLGLAVGRSKNRIAATGVTHLRQETAHVALYGQKQLKHGFTADAAVTYGDTETKLSAASWTQKSAALTARLTHATMLSDATAFRTFGGLTYEATDAGSIGTVHTGSVQNLRAELGAGATHTVGKAHLYAEAAFTGDMVRHNPTVDFDGARTHGANPGRLGLRATVGGIYEFTDTWSGTASYGIEAESRSTSHILNIGVSKSF